MDFNQTVVLVRHGETEWSRGGQHTGKTDIPLTEQGRREAQALEPRLSCYDFGVVLTSPMSRAIDTCAEAGFAAQARQTADLMEWDYGDYEGITSAQIRESDASWSLWRDGGPNGEVAADVGKRVDRVIETVRSTNGNVLIFAHGHVLRVLTARWLGLEPQDGCLFSLSTASISELAYEHQTAVVKLLNDCSAL